MWQVKNENNNQVQCSLVKSPIIYLEPIPRRKIELLMEEYTHREWLAYLKGRVSEKENFFVEGLSIPPHKESSHSSAEAAPFHIPKDCIGVIHSHHSMGAFHSGTDQAYVDKNFLISITVAKKAQALEFDAISYQVTPCGKGTTSSCVVKYVQPQPLFNEKEFLKNAGANIDKGIKVYTHYAQGVPNIYTQYNLLSSKGQPPPKVYTVDGKGNVMTQTELDEIMQDIWD